MSYELSVILWDGERHGLPTSFDDAVEMSEKLENIPDEPSSRLLDFAERLMASERAAGCRYTIFDSVLAEVKSHGTAAIALEIPRDSTELSLSAIASAAKESGLVGFVEGLFLAFLPDGGVLPPSRLEFWRQLNIAKKSVKTPSKLSAEQFIILVDDKVRNFFETNGFEHKEVSWGLNTSKAMAYQRVNGDIVQTIMIQPTDRSVIGGSISFDYSGVSRIIRMFNIVERPYVFRVNMRRLFFSSVLYEPGAKIFKAADEALDALLVSILAKINEVNSLGSLVDLMLLDCDGDLQAKAFINEFDFSCIPERAVACKLVNNPRFEELIASFESVRFWGVLQEKRDVEWPRLLKYLREEYK